MYGCILYHVAGRQCVKSSHTGCNNVYAKSQAASIRVLGTFQGAGKFHGKVSDKSRGVQDLDDSECGDWCESRETVLRPDSNVHRHRPRAQQCLQRFDNTKPFQLSTLHTDGDFSLLARSAATWHKPLTTDFEHSLYVRGFKTLFSGNGKTFRDEGNALDRKNFSGGYAMYAFDLTSHLGVCNV